MRCGWLALVCVGLSACPDPITITSSGEDTWKYFPLDGDRTWTYQSDNTSLPYRLVAHKPAENEVVNDLGTRAYTISFNADCLGIDPPCDVDADGDLIPDVETTPLFVWKLSSDSSRGAQFHAFNDEIFDPAVKLASADMSDTEVVTTESGGTTFSATIISEEPCDVPYWRGQPPEGCKVFQLDDGGAGSPIAGEYMSIVQFGIVRFRQGTDGDTWSLKAYEDEL